MTKKRKTLTTQDYKEMLQRAEDQRTVALEIINDCKDIMETQKAVIKDLNYKLSKKISPWDRFKQKYIMGKYIRFRQID